MTTTLEWMTAVGRSVSEWVSKCWRDSRVPSAVRTAAIDQHRPFPIRQPLCRPPAADKHIAHRVKWRTHLETPRLLPADSVHSPDVTAIDRKSLSTSGPRWSAHAICDFRAITNMTRFSTLAKTLTLILCDLISSKLSATQFALAANSQTR